MPRKLRRMTAAAFLIPAIAIMAGSSSAAARGTAPLPVDATNYTVSCSNFYGGMVFQPKVYNGSGTLIGKVKGEVTGCTAVPSGGGAAVEIADGKVSGPLTFAPTDEQSGCDTILGYPTETPYPTAGTLTIAWKTLKGSPKLSSGNSVLQPTNVITELGTNEENFSVPGSPGGVSGTGSFEGVDGGNSDSFAFALGISSSEIEHDCFYGSGLHHVRFGYGGVPFDLG